MVVLLDLEWIEQQQEKHLTQLSAIRTDADWQESSHLNVIVKPSASCMTNLNHIAYGGYGREALEQGLTEEECLSTFRDWLRPEDVVWVWAESNQQYLNELWRQYIPGAALPECY